MRRTLLFLLAWLILFALPVFPLGILSDLVVHYSNFSYISSVAVGYDYVYFGTTNGLTRYEIASRKWAEPMTGIDGLPAKEIREVRASQNDQYVWVRTDIGLFEYNRTFDRWSPIMQFPNESSFGKHLQPDFSYFPPPGFTYLPSGVIVDDDGKRFPVTDIIDDGWANLWIGTWGLGALWSDNTNHLLQLLKYGLIQNDVAAICSDSGILWIGGQSHDSYRTGITSFDWRKNDFDHVEIRGGLIRSSESVYDLSAGKERIYAATDNGILVIDKKSRQIVERIGLSFGLPDLQVYSLRLNGDTIFAGTEFGLARLDMSTDSTDKSIGTLLYAEPIYALERESNALWIGSEHGLYRLDLSSGKLGILSIPEVSESARIYDLAIAGEKIWVASEENLISIGLDDAQVETFPEVINYGGARAVAARDSLVALAVRDGLLLLFLGDKPHHFLYTVNDGLLSHNIQTLLFDGDYLWLGCERGLTRFWYRNPNLYH